MKIHKGIMNMKNVVSQHISISTSGDIQFCNRLYGNTLTFSFADKGKLSFLPLSNWMCNFDHHQHIRLEKLNGHHEDLKMRGL